MMIPAVKSGDVPFEVTPEIMLLVMLLAPNEHDTTITPAVLLVPLQATDPIKFLLILALTTSFPVSVEVEKEVVPKEIPNPSDELLIPETLFPEITTPSSKPTRMPPF